MKHLVLGFLILMTSGILFAREETEYYDGTGEAVWPINNNQVEMVEAAISITAVARKNERDDFVVNSTFVFINAGGDSRVQMGFTDFHRYSMDCLEDISTVTDYQCWVNGELVNVEPRSDFSHPLEYLTHSDKFYVLDIAFKQGETKSVRNVYRFGRLEYAGMKGMTYILRTSALWKGVVGKVKITINGIDTRFLESIEPEGYILV